MTQPIHGGVYFVRDSRLILIPAEERKVHEERRLVVVLSGSETNVNPEWRFVLVCPISGSTKHKTRYCVKLGTGEGGVSKKCWIRVPAIQPMMKDHLEDRAGTLQETKLTEVFVRLTEYLGLHGDEV